jgi:hypothetical protein
MSRPRSTTVRVFQGGGAGQFEAVKAVELFLIMAAHGFAK